jgi:DNA topoisomerase-1
MINKTDNILIIVESPNKVKTITDILKKANYTNATVMASVGHILELKNGGPAYNSGIYPDKDFQMNLSISPEKKKIVDEITKQAKKVDTIVIMTDDDRAGFFIGWSVVNFCKLPAEKCIRAITHEITPKAVIYAIENPVPFNTNLVDAECARMMTDKLIGFALSPLGKKYLGAKSIGRCQSVGLKLVSDREKEILDFIPELYYNLYLIFTKNNKEFKAKYWGFNEEAIDKFTKQADVDAVISNCKNKPFIIENIESITHKESPKPPFCTATFQQEASSKLGLKIKDAMSCAQKLFEGIKVNGEHVGLISYIRTDSTDLAPEFIPELKSYIIDTFGIDKYSSPRKGKSKTTDQNGHEALRVTDPTMTPEKVAKYVSNELLVKVYKLIWQRTIAAAMPNAIISETLYTINNSGHKFKLSSRTLVDAGYRLVYEYEDNQILGCDETFSIAETLNNAELEANKLFTKPKARFTEASLVKELQARSIGRPSTYSTIVETVLSPTRGYAKLEEKCIVPSDRGMQLADYCDRSFPTLINLNYTKQMEEQLDKIATGELHLLDYMNNFYKHLTEVVTSTSEVGLAADLKEEKSCPDCGGPMTIRRSRFGKLFYGCSSYPKCRGIIGID